MVKRMPIHALKDTLEQARFQAIQILAPASGTMPLLSDEALRRLALIQSALIAVREEIAAHEVKVGGGAEQPLE
jgi:hypothetical protein